MIKTFKGKIAEDGLLQIRLSTNDGLTGYVLRKFQLMPTAPGVNNVEHVAKIFTTENNETGATRTPDATVNLDDPTLIGVAYYQDNGSSGVSFMTDVIIDNVTVNQDIYVTHVDAAGGTTGCNFYIELEKVKLSKDEAAVATLKDMRAGPDTNFGS